MIVLAAIIIVLLGAYSFIRNAYNKALSFWMSRVRASWSQVENQLRTCYDLIPKPGRDRQGICEIREGSAYKKLPLNARARVGGAQNVSDKIAANNQLFLGALSRLLVVVECYPELKANQNFLL